MRLGKNLRRCGLAGCTICGMTNRTYKIGHSREQASLLPPCLEDYVDHDNPVRAIDAYVASLDLMGLEFCDVGSDGGAGQPPYAPGDLLKLYLYGYLNQVRSSRRLARETRRNVEVMWLLRGLTPGYRTIADFRKNNAAGLQAVNREFVGVCALGAPPGLAGRRIGGDRWRVLPRRRQQGEHPDREATGRADGGLGPQHRRVRRSTRRQRQGRGGERRSAAGGFGTRDDAAAGRLA